MLMPRLFNQLNHFQVVERPKVIAETLLEDQAFIEAQPELVEQLEEVKDDPEALQTVLEEVFAAESSKVIVETLLQSEEFVESQPLLVEKFQENKNNEQGLQTILKTEAAVVVKPATTASLKASVIAAVAKNVTQNPILEDSKFTISLN